MAGLSVGGIATGLDVDGLVSQLMAIEKRPQQLLGQRTKEFQDKLSSLGKIKSALSSLQSSLSSLKDPNKVMPLSAKLQNEAVAGVSVTSAKASAGVSSFEVIKLAQADKQLSTAFSGSLNAAFSAAGGTLNIKLGADPVGKDVTIAAGASIESVRDSINAANAGVTASIFQTEAGKYQLMVASKATGSSQNISMTGVAELDTATAMQSKMTAQDALFKVDGVSFTRGSNKVSDAVLGLEFDLKAEGTTSLTVATDPAALKTTVQGFVTAYNALRTSISQETASDPKAQTRQPLSGDSAVNGILAKIRSQFSTAFGDGQHAADLGLKFDKSGVLSLDSAKFDKAVTASPDDVAKFFVSVDPVTLDKVGFASAVSSQIDTMLLAGGIFSSKTDSINKSISTLGKRQEQMQVRLEQTEARFRKQFAGLEDISSKFTALNNFLTRQLGS